MTKEPDRSHRKALGKGLSALLPSRAANTDQASVTSQAVAVQPPGNRAALPEKFEDFQSIPLHQISPNEEQPRSAFNDEKLQELAQSIRANGLLQPVTVYRIGPDQYRLIAGERRWRAAELAGLREIPALVRSIEQHQLLELALIENIQREDLNAVEIASAFHSLATHHGLSHEQIAERTGKDRSTVTNFVRLLRLSPFVREALAAGHVSVGHARTLLNITDEAAQADICRRIIEQELSVRETERLIKSLTDTQSGKNKGELKTEGKPVDPNVRAALEEIASALGTRVKLHARSATAGRLEIEYYSQEDLDRIYSVITKQ
jgi:ParB family transcriptional regulator, chromosome partitioning protein